MKVFKSSDPWAGVVIVLTVGLFGLSLAVKGFTHELFLDMGVFLVSVKLILMAARNAATEKRLEQHLHEIKELLTGSGSQDSTNEEKSTGNTAWRIRQIC